MYYISLVFALICSIVIPIALSIYWVKRDRAYLKVILVGALTFFISQIVIRIPLLSYLEAESAFVINLGIIRPVLYAVALSLSAALFEEIARYISMKFILKNRRSVKDAVAFGVGHGGIEAILLIGINLIFLLFIYIPNVEPLMIISSGVERLSAISLHVFCSVLVMKSVRTASPIFLVAAIALHTAVNFVAIYLQQIGTSYLIIELVLIVIGVILLWLTNMQLRQEKEN